jgi:hypothetical protein
MEKLNAFITSGDSGEVQAIWDDIFMAPEVPVALLQSNPDVVISFLNKAVALKPSWTTTKCAVAVERLTGAALVAASTAEYNSCWVYSIALACEADPGTAFTMSDRQADIAFRLCRCWRAAAGRALPPALVSDPAAAPEVRPAAAGRGDAEMREQATSGEDEEENPLEWEEQEEPLPGDLLQVVRRFTGGSLRVDARSLLDELPRWQHLKQKAEANNHRQDASRPTDRVLRLVQQKVLGLLRIYPVLHHGLQGKESKEEAADEEYQEDQVVLGQKFYCLMLDLENFILQERKKLSLPGSIPSTEPQLFTQDDLKINAEQQKINAAGTFFKTKKVFISSTAASGAGLWHLCPPPRLQRGKTQAWLGQGQRIQVESPLGANFQRQQRN